MSRHNWMILWLLQSYTFPVMFLALWSHSWSNFRLISWWFRYYSLELKTITRLFEIIMQPKSLNPADLPANLRKSISLTKRNYYLLTKLTIASLLILLLTEKQSYLITSSYIKEFIRGAQVFVIVMLSKLFERSSLGSCSASMNKYFWPIEYVSAAKRKVTWKIKSSSEVFH